MRQQNATVTDRQRKAGPKSVAQYVQTVRCTTHTLFLKKSAFCPLKCFHCSKYSGTFKLGNLTGQRKQNSALSF